MYEKHIKKVWEDLSLIHYKKINLFEDINLMEKVALKKNEKSKEKLNVEKLTVLVKPNINDRKYQYNRKKIDVFFSKAKKRRIKEKLRTQFENDLNEYSRQLELYKEQSYRNAKTKYYYYLNKGNYKKRKLNIIDKHRKLKKGYFNFKNSEKVNDYFRFVMNNFKTKHWFYEGNNFESDVDIDTKCMYLDLQIPPQNIYPYIEKFRVIKSSLECNEYNYKKKERDAYVTIALNSYVLYFINLFKKADYENNINYLILNLTTENFSADTKRCNKTIKIKFDKISNPSFCTV